MRYVVAFYRMDRAYGGPEEGGWWYDCGTLERLYRVYTYDNGAHQAVNRANRLLERLQRNHRQIDSVIYDQSRFRAIMFEGIPPDHYPRDRPHYS
jgi:hypothetical protein